jgi:hypothetical protein
LREEGERERIEVIFRLFRILGLRKNTQGFRMTSNARDRRRRNREKRKSRQLWLPSLIP